MSIFKRQIRNNRLSNINDNGDNNEKKAKCLKTWVGIFGWGGGDFLGDNFPGGNSPGGNFIGGNFPVGSFPGGNFPDTYLIRHQQNRFKHVKRTSPKKIKCWGSELFRSRLYKQTL